MNEAAIVESICAAWVYRLSTVEIAQGGVEILLGGTRDAAIIVGVGQTWVDLSPASGQISTVLSGR